MVTYESDIPNWRNSGLERKRFDMERDFTDRLSFRSVRRSGYEGDFNAERTDRKRPERPGFKRNSLRLDNGMRRGVCHQFSATGKCKYGADCQFLHDSEAIRHQSRRVLGSKPCRQMRATGSCSYGDLCKFSHELEEHDSATDNSSEEQLSDRFSAADSETSGTCLNDEDVVSTSLPGGSVPAKVERKKEDRLSRCQEAHLRLGSAIHPIRRMLEGSAVYRSREAREKARASLEVETQSEPNNSSELETPEVDATLETNVIEIASAKSHVSDGDADALEDAPAKSEAPTVRTDESSAASLPYFKSALPFDSYPTINSPYTGTAYVNRLLSLEVEEFLRRLDEKMLSRRSIQRAAVQTLRKEVQEVWTSASVEVFGSASTDLSLPDSDIDIVLTREMDPSNQTAKDDALATLREVHAHLQKRSDSFKNLKLLEKAAIPVLKFVYYNDSGEVSMDITCSNTPQHTGYRARELVQSFLYQLPGLRSLVLILKLFLASRDLKDPFTGGISSYAIVLLVTRFLQSCGIQQTVYKPQSDQSHDPYNGIFPSVCTYSFNQTGGVWHTEIGVILQRLTSFYAAFDFRSVGVSVTDGGKFFRLYDEESRYSPVPWIDDPLCPGRNVCTTCFRMAEVVQAIGELHQALQKRIPLDVLLTSAAGA